MAEYSDREHFIPARREELVDRLCAAPDLQPGQRGLFRALASRLCAVYHFEYQRRHGELDRAYCPFDPDRDTVTLSVVNSDERTRRINDLFRAFGWLMERANFRRLTPNDLDPGRQKASDWGLPMDVDFGAFERIHIFVRGDMEQKRPRRRISNYYRKEEVLVPVYQRLVLILKMRMHPRLPSWVDTENVYLKMFKNIPQQDVKMLLPGARIRFSRLDHGKITVPLAGGLGYLVWKFLTSLGIALWNLTDDALNLLLGASNQPQLLWMLASGAVGYGYKGYYNYQQTRQRYHHSLAEILYYQNMDSNAGVLTRLVSEGEEQDAREALLAYFFLWVHAGQEGWTGPHLDDRIEEYLEKSLGIKVDFEIDCALEKLEALRLVSRTDDHYRVVSPEQAIETLTWFWTNYFGPGNLPA